MKKILIDLEKYYKISPPRKLTAECSYFYHQGEEFNAPKNWGVEKLLAKAAQYVVCRQCKSPDCILSCPNEALGFNSNNILERYSMRCTSCKNCSVGCQFGTIYLDILPYRTSQCDYCIGRSNGKPPACVETDKSGVLQWVEWSEVEGDELARIASGGQENIYEISYYLLVQSPKWKK